MAKAETAAESKMSEVKPSTGDQVAILLTKSIAELREIHLKIFGVAYKAKNKNALAAKLAAAYAEGKTPDRPRATLPSDMDEAEAKSILSDLKATHVRIETLQAEKKVSLSKVKEEIVKCETVLTETLSDTTLDPKVGMEKVRGIVKILRDAQRNKAEKSREFNDRIKTAKDGMRGTLDSINQYPLKFDSAASTSAGPDVSDEDDEDDED